MTGWRGLPPPTFMEYPRELLMQLQWMLENARTADGEPLFPDPSRQYAREFAS